MEVLANDQQLRSLANIYAYFNPQPKCSIVIATANPSTTSFLQTAFEQTDHCIEMCTSNVEIVKAVQNHVVDVLIIDNDYDSMEGIKLLESIREIDQRLPVVFIGKADASPELLSLHIWDLEPYEYRTELIEPVNLVGTIEQIISNRKSKGNIEKSFQQIYDLKTFTVYDIYIIGLDGRLLYHHSNDLITHVDEDIFGGMFTVLQMFLDDVFKNWQGELTAIDYKSLKILIEHGSEFNLVVIGKGEILELVREHMASLVQHISNRYGLLIAHWSGNMGSIAGLKEEVEGIINIG